MTTRDEFVKAIESSPKDERLHRMFADWLDEQGLHEESAYHRRWTIEVAMAELWLHVFVNTHDCPDYDTVIAAAIGNHDLNRDSDYGDDYYHSSNDGEYLHFGGRDAHGSIPPEFWDKVEIAMGVKIDPAMRARHFSCSC